MVADEDVRHVVGDVDCAHCFQGENGQMVRFCRLHPAFELHNQFTRFRVERNGARFDVLHVPERDQARLHRELTLVRNRNALLLPHRERDEEVCVEFDQTERRLGRIHGGYTKAVRISFEEYFVANPRERVDRLG